MINDLAPYLVKKMAYFLFCLEERESNQSDHQKSRDPRQLMREIKRQAPDIPLPKLLRHYVDSCSNIVDEMSLVVNTLNINNNE